ncbi:glyoxalase family protein [Cooperia oncophora]
MVASKVISELTDPDGHWFLICPGQDPPKVVKVSVRVQDFQKSVDYWTNQLGMKVVEQRDKGRITMELWRGSGWWVLISVKETFGNTGFIYFQCCLEVRQLPEGTALDRGSGYGRIAFAYPDDGLSALQEKMKAAKLPILKELTTLDTPGKASVQVVILADPDDHEICFVGDKGFRELSKVDPKADEMIRREIEKDDSVSWFKDGKKKV